MRLTPTASPRLRLVDGVVFSPDGKTLLSCPSDKSGEYLVPDGVEKIGANAFEYCVLLTSVTLPAGLQTIESGAFRECHLLNNITLPAGLESIENDAFCGCQSLTSATLPAGLQTLGANAFYGCQALRDVTIPDSASDKMLSIFQGKKLRLIPTPSPRLRLIDGVVFSSDGKTLLSCPRDKSGDYVVPNGVVTIGDRAFADCDLLTSATLPDGLESIENDAFSGCYSLTSVTFPDSAPDAVWKPLRARTIRLTPTPSPRLRLVDGVLFTADGKTLLNCPRDKSGEYFVPDDVVSVEKDAFSGCNSLTIMLLDSASDVAWRCLREQRFSLAPTSTPRLRLVDGVLFTADGKTLLNCPRGKSGDYVVPGGVETIENEAFKGCASLTSLTFPNGLQTIRDYAFADCESLTSVTLPDGLQTIRDYAFADCESLTSVTFPSGLQTIGDVAFADCGADLTLYVPTGSVAEEYARENGLRFEAVDAETGTSDVDDGE